MSDMAVVFLVLGVTIVLFVWNRYPVEIVALGAALTLAATGVLTVPEALGGFGDLTVIYIAALFVVSEGIDAAGITTWAGQQLMLRAGGERRRLTVMMMLLVALLTAVISVNGAVAALIPMVVVMALRSRTSPSALMLPLAFGAHAGSLLVLTGTPVHILVIDAAVDAGADPFNFFEFALVGIPVVAAVIGVVVLLGPRLIPSRAPQSVGVDLSAHAHTLIDQYSLTDWVSRLEVDPGSPLAGVTPSSMSFDAYPGLELVGVQGVLGVAHALDEPMDVGFVVTVRGDDDLVARFAADMGLRVLPGKTGGSVLNREIGAAEVVIPPRSPLIGAEVFPGIVTSTGDIVVLAVHRNGEPVIETTRLVAGDVVLAQGTWEALDAGAEAAGEVLVVDAPSAVKRQAIPMGAGAKRALAILALMVLLLATGAVPPAVAALLAAGAMILSGVVPMKDAYRAVSWTTVVLVAAMIPVSDAVTSSGAAGAIADRLIDVVGDLGPHALLLGIFLVTAVFGQLISNMATALIVIPIAVTAANDLGVSVRPVLMCVTVAAAAAFLTPVATPANLMIMQPAGYRFGDYWRLGLPLLTLFGLAAVFLVPMFWSF